MPGAVVAKPTATRKTPTAQSIKASKTRGLTKPDCESEFVLIVVFFRLDCLRDAVEQGTRKHPLTRFVNAVPIGCMDAAMATSGALQPLTMEGLYLDLNQGFEGR